MKYSNINVEFKKPENEIKEQLSRSGARNIDIRRNYNGELEVRYTIKCADPEKEIQSLLSNAGTDANTCVISRYNQLLILNVDIVKIVDTKYRKL